MNQQKKMMASFFGSYQQIIASVNELFVTANSSITMR